MEDKKNSNTPALLGSCSLSNFSFTQAFVTFTPQKNGKRFFDAYVAPFKWAKDKKPI